MLCTRALVHVRTRVQSIKPTSDRTIVFQNTTYRAELELEHGLASWMNKVKKSKMKPMMDHYRVLITVKDLYRSNVNKIVVYRRKERVDDCLKDLSIMIWKHVS